MARRLVKIAGALLAALLIALAAAVVLLLTAPVQTYLVRRALHAVNATIGGTVSADFAHLSLRGELLLRELEVRDPDGEPVLQLDSVHARVRLWPLWRDSIHVQQLSAGRLRVNLAVDSAGGSNLLRALSPRAPAADTASAPLAWTIRVDRAHIGGGETRIRYADSLWWATDKWTLDATGGLARDSLCYEIDMQSPGQFKLAAAGSLVPGEIPGDPAGEFALHVDSAFAAGFHPLVATFGTLDILGSYATHGDSLRATLELDNRALGVLKAEAALPYPMNEPALRGSVDFENFTPGALWGERDAVTANGRLDFRKQADAAPLNGWEFALRLDDTRYDRWRLVHAEVLGTTRDSTARVDGKVELGAGRLVLTSRVEGFDPRTAQLRVDVKFARLDLRPFSEQIPDTLEPLTGSLHVAAQGLDPERINAELSFTLDRTALGSLAADSLHVRAHLRGTAFTLDTLHAAAAGAAIGLHAAGTRGGEARWEARMDVPDIAATAEQLKPWMPEADSTGGSLQGTLSGTASLAGDSISRIQASGTITLEGGYYGDYRVEHADVNLENAAVDVREFSGTVTLRELTVADQRIDAVDITLHGAQDAYAAAVELRARGDSITAAGGFGFHPTADGGEIAVDMLSADVYGTLWYTEGQTHIAFSPNGLYIDALTLRSPYGVLRATGMLRHGGEQDMTVEVSGLETGGLAQLFKKPIPESTVNIRLQIIGADTALTGDISVFVDSVKQDGRVLADEIHLHGTVDKRRALVDGLVMWMGDTLTLFAGELPARISLDEGFALLDSLPMQGRLRLLEQPLDRLNGYLPFGMSFGGKVAGEMEFSGTPAKPSWAGTFDLTDGRYRDVRSGVDYRKITINGTVAGDTLRIPHFDLTAGGTLLGTGWAIMDVPLPSELHLDLNFDEFNVLNGPTMQAQTTGHIEVHGPFNALDATGWLDITEGMYRITQATSKEIEEIDLEAELARLRGDTATAIFSPTRFYQSLAHDVTVRIPGNVWVKGGGMNMELTGRLSLKKEHHDEPAVNGEIRVRNGTMVFYGRELRIAEGGGFVRFTGPMADPDLDITADVPRPPAGVRDASARLRGPVSETQVELEGHYEDGTAMSQADVLTALTLGINPRDASGSAASGAAATAAASQLSGMVGRLTGLDMFQYRTGEGGLSDLAGGSLEVGTYLTDRLFVRVVQPIETTQGGQEVSVEYRLLEWLKLRAQQTGKENSALDLLFQIDWR